MIDYFPLAGISATAPNEILLIAATRETVDRHLATLSAAGIAPETINISTTALCAALEAAGNLRENFASAYFDDDFWEITLFSHSRLAVSRGFPLTNDTNSGSIKNEITNSVAMSGLGAPEAIYYFDQGKTVEKLKDIPLAELPFDTTRFPLIQREGLATETLKRYIIPLGLILPSHFTVNLLPAELKEKSAGAARLRFQLKMGAIVAALTMVVGMSIFGISYYRSTANRAMLRMVKENKQEILELAKIDKELQAIERFTAHNMLPLEVLRDISRELPANVYLRQFDYNTKENTVMIRGRAATYAGASQTAARLGKSKYFSQVSNKGSYMIKIGDRNLIDFDITCTLNKG